MEVHKFTRSFIFLVLWDKFEEIFDFPYPHCILKHDWYETEMKFQTFDKISLIKINFKLTNMRDFKLN